MATNALNRIEPRYYRVDIVGAVDNLNVEQYAIQNGDAAQDYQDELPTSDVASDAIEHTNMRYEEVIRRVSERIQPLFTADIVTASRTNMVPAVSLSVTLPYDRPEYIITEDELNDNVLIGFGIAGSSAEDAITRMVARALIFDIVENRNTYHPDAQVGATPVGFVIAELTATLLYADLATAEGNITVTEILQLVD